MGYLDEMEREVRKMNQRATGGFTLIEVVLAIAVGLIIIAGVSVGYTYAKRSAILDNQRKDVQAIKTFVEQAIAQLQANMASGDNSNPNTNSGLALVPPLISNSQLRALSERLPSLKFDPYNGTQRDSCPNVLPGPCYHSVGDINNGNGPISGGDSYGPDLEGGDNNSSVPDVNGWNKGAGSAVVYIPGETFKVQFSITLADGSTRTFFGYVVLETDQDGNIVAADGGDTTTQQIGT